MNQPVLPYLFFEGRADEAVAFYAKALGAQPGMMLRYKDSPEGGKGPGGITPPGDKVMHGEMKINDNAIFFADGMCSGKTNFAGFSLVFTAKDVADAQRRFDALAQGGQVTQPLIETFFCKAFGMVADKFGLQWMVMAEPKGPGPQ
jgi:PhnB protein